MAKINEKTQAPAGAVTGALDFDNVEGAVESVTRRPSVAWTELAGRDNDNKDLVVAGWYIETQKFNNPTGSERNVDYWLGAIIELTHPCKTMKDGKEYLAQPGEEVIVGYGTDGTDLAKHLEPRLGHDVMFWCAIRPAGVLPLKGKQPMRLFDVKFGQTGQFAPKKRMGRYLIGGATSKIAQLVEAPSGVTQAQKNSAASQVAALQG